VAIELWQHGRGITVGAILVIARNQEAHMLRIKSKRDKFRRCGVAHPATDMDYPDGRFTGDQIKILQAEPMLIVRELPEPAQEPERESGTSAPPSPGGKRKKELKE
jgi:hypothetical protein